MTANELLYILFLLIQGLVRTSVLRPDRTQRIRIQRASRRRQGNTKRLQALARAPDEKSPTQQTKPESRVLANPRASAPTEQEGPKSAPAI